MNTSDQDRRRSGRHQVELDAHYNSSAMDLQARVTSLSTSGLFVESDFLDSPNTLVALSLTLRGDPRPLSIAGRVAWVDASPRQSGMGIQFTDLSRKCRQRLARYMADAHSERTGSVASGN